MRYQVKHRPLPSLPRVVCALDRKWAAHRSFPIPDPQLEACELCVVMCSCVLDHITRDAAGRAASSSRRLSSTIDRGLTHLTRYRGDCSLFDLRASTADSHLTGLNSGLTMSMLKALAHLILKFADPRTLRVPPWARHVFPPVAARIQPTRQNRTEVKPDGARKTRRV